MPTDESTTLNRSPASADTADSLAIICGGGSFPAAVVEVAIQRGRRVVLFALKGWADSGLVKQHPHHWIAIGQLGRFLRLAKAAHCRDVVIIGTLLRPPLRHVRLDWRTFRLLPRLAQAFRGGDDRLLSAVVGMIEEGGLRVIGVEEVAPEIVVPEGVLGRHQPSPRDRADIDRALSLIAALGPFDVGQAVVVADNNVLAVEAAEGTDAMLARITEMRGKGRVSTPSRVGVLVKAPKHGQDRRVDLPAIGRQTVENVARAGLAGLAVAAGAAIIAEAAAVTAAADQAGIFLVGVREESRP
jgi:DUF1009 family protein